MIDMNRLVTALLFLQSLALSVKCFTTDTSPPRICVQKNIRNDCTIALSSLDSSSEAGTVRRRQVGELAIAAAGLSISFFGTREVDPTDYGLWGILPVGTYKKKKTIIETIIPGTIWTLDQKFGILNIQVPLRMTIIKLSSGGLFVYNPIAATRECLDYVRGIEQETGEKVKYIVVGSVALEHKSYAGVFAQKFPDAEVWLQPGQYAFPVNLPDTFLGFPVSRTKTIPLDPHDPSIPAAWKDEFSFATLGPIISRDGAFGETVFCHKPTKTLLVTDTAIQVTDEVPAIFETDPGPLLFHARDSVADKVEDTPEVRKRGWRRVVIFGLYFMPSAIIIKDINVALEERRPDINPAFAGLYPWEWVGDEKSSWEALTGKGKPLVAPILQTLLLNRSPLEVLDFADRVGSWDFDRIIPAHLKNNLRFNGKDYRDQFSFLEVKGVPDGFPVPLKADLQLLLDAEENLVASGAITPAPPKANGQYSRQQIIDLTSYKCRKGVCAPKATA